MQANFVVFYRVISYAMWLKNFVCTLGFVDSILKPLKIYCDDSLSVFFIKNDRITTTSKHIRIKFLIVKEMVGNEEILVKHIIIEDMFMDPLTKRLRLIVFIKHVEKLVL